MNKNYELDYVGVRLIKEKTVMFETKINKPMDAVNFLKDEMSLYDREVVLSLNLNTRGEVINVYTVAMGGLNESVIDPKCIYKSALLSNASSIILIHNHPSGDLKPSDADLSTTECISKGGRLLGIKLVDHIIVGGNKYYSMMEHRQV